MAEIILAAIDQKRASERKRSDPLSRLRWHIDGSAGLGRCYLVLSGFTLVTRRPYCPGRPKKLWFTTLSLTMETMGMRLSLVKQSFFGRQGQYGRLVTRANCKRPYRFTAHHLSTTHQYFVAYGKVTGLSFTSSKFLLDLSHLICNVENQ